jgi:hypothetical protein
LASGAGCRKVDERPELSDSPVPAQLDARMIPLLENVAG